MWEKDEQDSGACTHLDIARELTLHHYSKVGQVQLVVIVTKLAPLGDDFPVLARELHPRLRLIEEKGKENGGEENKTNYSSQPLSN
jgi:hypothetical protein